MITCTPQALDALKTTVTVSDETELTLAFDDSNLVRSHTLIFNDFERAIPGSQDDLTTNLTRRQHNVHI